MNVAQILRQSLYDIDAIRQDNTTDPFFVQQEMLHWADQAKEKVEKVVRQAKEDYNLLVLQSNDDPYRWGGVDYDPSSLQLVAGTHRYILPPDLHTIRRIRCLTSGYEDIEFIPRDISGKVFRDTENYPDSTSSILPFDIVGDRTLYIAADPPTTIDIEIAYIAKSTGLQLYSTGSVTLTNASATVSGGGTSWVDNELYATVELIISDDATVPKIVGQTSTGTWVDSSRIYPTVQTIVSNGELTLGGVWSKAGVTGKGYLLATVPSIPREHHHLITDWVCYRAMKKAQSSAQKSFLDSFEKGVAEMKSDMQARQTHDPVCVEDVDFWR